MAIRGLILRVIVANGLEWAPGAFVSEETNTSYWLRQLHEAGQLVSRFRQVLGQGGYDVPKLVPRTCLLMKPPFRLALHSRGF